MIRKFNLKMGPNKLVYSVNIEGKIKSVEGSIYLYDSSDKVVISDIDGTITKSDVLG